MRDLKSGMRTSLTKNLISLGFIGFTSLITTHDRIIMLLYILIFYYYYFYFYYALHTKNSKNISYNAYYYMRAVLSQVQNLARYRRPLLRYNS
jgi:hypothetical protein